MKKLFYISILCLIFASCKETYEDFKCYHPYGVTFINKTGLSAQVEIKCMASYIDLKPGDTIHMDAHVELQRYSTCLIGKPIIIYMYDKNTVGQPVLYEFTDIISDTVIIDSTEFKH